MVDGVGGESGGEIAAQTALEILQARLSRRTTDAARLIREAIALANKQIYEQAQANPEPRRHGLRADGGRGRRRPGHDRPRRRQPALPAARPAGSARSPATTPRSARARTPARSRRRRRCAIRAATRSSATWAPRRMSRTRRGSSTSRDPLRARRGAAALQRRPLRSGDRRRRSSPLVERHAANRKAAVQELIDAANAAGGKDNVSVVLVEGERFAAAARQEPRASRRRAPAPACPARLRGAGRGPRRRRGPAILGGLLGAYWRPPRLPLLWRDPRRVRLRRLRPGAAPVHAGGSAGDPANVLRVGAGGRRHRHDRGGPGAGPAGADGRGGARRVPRGAPAPRRRRAW